MLGTPEIDLAIARMKCIRSEVYSLLQQSNI